MRHPFAPEPLATDLRQHLPGFGEAITAQQFGGGHSSPTDLLEAGGRRRVLRRKPPGVLLPAAHAIDREYCVMAALAHSALPVPHVHLLSEDDAVIGSAFYVMDHVEGRSFRDPSLPGTATEQRGAIYDELNRVIAALHGVDIHAAGLSGFGRPGLSARPGASGARQAEDDLPEDADEQVGRSGGQRRKGVKREGGLSLGQGPEPGPGCSETAARGYRQSAIMESSP